MLWFMQDDTQQGKEAQLVMDVQRSGFCNWNTTLGLLCIHVS